MTNYRSVWVVVWGGASVVGVCLAFLAWSAPTVVTLFVVAAAMAALLTVAYYTSQGAQPVPRSDLVRHCVANGVGTGLGLVAASALSAIASVLLWPMLLLAAATSPWNIGHWVRRSKVNAALPNDAQPVDTTMSSAVAASWAQALTDQELCREWRASFDALQSQPTPVMRERIVSLRQAYLDEIDRRNPAALSAWLASGARAAGSPDKYLSSSHGDDQVGSS